MVKITLRALFCVMRLIHKDKIKSTLHAAAIQLDTVVVTHASKWVQTAICTIREQNFLSLSQPYHHKQPCQQGHSMHTAHINERNTEIWNKLRNHGNIKDVNKFGIRFLPSLQHHTLMTISIVNCLFHIWFFNMQF